MNHLAIQNPDHLGQMPAQRIERRRPLASKQLASPTNSAWSSIDRTGTNRWPANHRHVDRLVVVAPQVGLHMGGRDQPHFEAKRQQLPPPMVGHIATTHRESSEKKPSLHATTISPFAPTT
jgi:hypothetical protein